MKNKYEKKKTIFAVLLLMLLSTASSIVFASTQPTVTLNPEAPYRQSTVTFTANIADIDVTNIYIHVQECNGNLGLCYPEDSTVSMTQMSAYTYGATLTLKHSEATYIEYTLIVENNGEWTKYLESTKVTVKTIQNKVTIITEPSSAIVFIEDKKCREKIVDKGELINVSISKEHYYSIKDSFIVDRDITKYYNLERSEFLLRISSEPNNADIFINGENINSIWYYGFVNISVCRPFSVSYDVIIYLDSDTNLVVTLDSIEHVAYFWIYVISAVSLVFILISFVLLKRIKLVK